MSYILKVPNQFEVDMVKAISIARILLDLINQGHWLASMPEDQLPQNLVAGSREHALYLTYVISIDYMTDAEKLWNKARCAYELHPENFTPEKILELDKEKLQDFLRRLGARFDSKAAETWKKISAVLMEKYNGDPRNITVQPLTIKEIKERLSDFPYLRGAKLTNFYIRVMAEKGLFKVKDLNELDIPVDIEVTRFTVYTGVLRLKSGKFRRCVNDDPLRSLIQEVWRNAAKTIGTAPWRLDEPMWNIGSKLCREGFEKCGQCPVENLCNKTKGVTFKGYKLIWWK